MTADGPVILGNVTLDDLYLPEGTTARDVCGGDAIYAAIGASRWTGSVAMVARVVGTRRTLATTGSGGGGWS